MIELNRIHNMDCLNGLKLLDDNSVDCCITSPPYWGLRDYGCDEQLGLESTPEEYVAKMVKVFHEVKRVLKPEGTLFLNLGDSYAGSGKGAANYPDNAMKYKQGTNKGMVGASATTKVKYKPKDLIGIPWSTAFALRADGWYLRQDIIWAKPNPMPESVTDRCTKSHEYIFLMAKSQKYYYDNEAIKEPVSDATIQRLNQDIESQKGSDRVPNKTNGNMKAAAPRYGGNKYTKNPDVFNRTKSGNAYDFRENRNKRSVPEDLIEPCVLAGCPKDGIILDPFMGAGTTAAVAINYGRNFIGFELNKEYCDIAEKRIAGLSRPLFT